MLLIFLFPVAPLQLPWLGTAYVTFTPDTEQHNGRISVASGVFSDSAGNTNQDGSDYITHSHFRSIPSDRASQSLMKMLITP